MTGVVRRSPFYEQETTAGVAGRNVIVRAYQIAVWVSLRIRSAVSHPFPAVLDTGHSHFFSVGEDHLFHWLGIRRADIRVIGRGVVNGRPVELFAAGLALCRNRNGRRDELLEKPYSLQLPEGIVIHERSDPWGPRLPLLGLRALVQNDLRVVIDSRHKHVTISRPWHPFG
jgi:hypothetical protein